MSKPPKDSDADAYKVGYGKPPSHTRFRKGVSGNPGGRPRGMTAGRANKLMLREFYRPIKIREGDQVISVPAFQVVARQLVTQAAKGNNPAARTVIEQNNRIEQQAIDAAARGTKHRSEAPVSDRARAQALAAFIAKTRNKPTPTDGSGT